VNSRDGEVLRAQSRTPKHEFKVVKTATAGLKECGEEIAEDRGLGKLECDHPCMPDHPTATYLNQVSSSSTKWPPRAATDIELSSDGPLAAGALNANTVPPFVRRS
jgi:hypothetical protein